METRNLGPCPRCSARPPLQPGDLKGVPVGLCQGCKGILMSRGDLDAIVAIVARNNPKRRSDGAQYFDRLKDVAAFVDGDPNIPCPNCRYDMYEVQSHGLVVDFCMSCQHVWFDAGELQGALREAREHGGVDLIPPDLSGNDTAELICYLLDTVTADKSPS